jgi:hypothetical protein
MKKPGCSDAAGLFVVLLRWGSVIRQHGAGKIERAADQDAGGDGARELAAGDFGQGFCG